MQKMLFHVTVYAYILLHLPVKVLLQDANHREMLLMQLLFGLCWSLI